MRLDAGYDILIWSTPGDLQNVWLELDYIITMLSWQVSEYIDSLR